MSKIFNPNSTLHLDTVLIRQNNFFDNKTLFNNSRLTEFARHPVQPSYRSWLVKSFTVSTFGQLSFDSYDGHQRSFSTRMVAYARPIGMSAVQCIKVPEHISIDLESMRSIDH
jgi:hypothetical protein